MARRTTLVCLLGAAALAASAAAAPAAPFVRVTNVQLDRPTATVSADVRWDATSARTQQMRLGTVRLVAESDVAHRATFLGAEQPNTDVGARPVQHVSITVDGARERAAMAAGNRIVLTATQKMPAGGSRVPRAYVTVAQVQPYAGRQPHIGTDDCSDKPVVAGAILDYCDLVGADLERVIVSLHSPSAYECQRQTASSCLRRADLSGAVLSNANLSGANLAGARLNDADLRSAQLDNVSLAGADAIGMDARESTSDQKATDTAADMFGARLSHADLSGTVYNGISFAQAHLDDVTARRARWTAISAHGTDFRGADLSGTDFKEAPSDFDYVDLTDARLYTPEGGQATLPAGLLAWAYLCRTQLNQKDRADRDCHKDAEDPTIPLPGVSRADPYIRVTKASIDGAGAKSRHVHADVAWATGLPYGTLRLLAVDRQSGLPTVLDERVYKGGLPSTYDVDITDATKLAAAGEGNRVVLTATQYPPSAGAAPVRYVTVKTLQSGPGRGRVGMYDCSRLALTPTPPQPLDFCDLTGAELSNAIFTATFLRESSLTGATLDASRIAATPLSGSAMGGLHASGSRWSNADLFVAHAPRLNLDKGFLDGSPMRAHNLDGASFQGAWITGSTTSFAGASMRRANFYGALLEHTDLALTDLTNATFVAAQSAGDSRYLGGSTLFLSDLTSADLSRSTWTLDEAREVPWTWSVVCATQMPADAGGISGDRDCPRTWGARNR
jgi:uncharacterized protein YjbI with pentapeptide repeats